MAALSQLYVEFRASTEKLNADLNAAKREIKQFEKAWAPTISILETIGTTAAAAGAAIVTTLIATTKIAADYGDKIRDAGIQTGLTTQMMAGLKVMAEQNGSSLEEMSNGLKFLAKNFVAATEGGKEQTDAFAKLGITTKDLKDAHGNLEPVMRLVMDRLKEMPNGAEKTALELKLMGKSAVGLTEAMGQGSEALDNYISLTRLLGTDVTPEAAAAADKFNDALNILGQSLLGFNNTVGNELIPAMTVVVDVMTAAVVTAKDYVVQIVELGNAAAITANAFYGSGGLGTALAGVLSVIPGGNKIFADLAVNYEKLQTATTAATHLQKMFSDALGDSHTPLKNSADDVKKLEDAHFKLNKQIYDAAQFWEKAEKAETSAIQKNLSEALALGELRMKREALNVAMERTNEINQLSIQSTNLLVDSLKNVDEAMRPMLRDLEAERGVNIAVQKTVDEVNKEMGISVDLIADVTGARREDIIAIRDRAKEEAKGTDAAKKAAESYQRMWEQATANVTSSFVKGLSDVIFHAKNFMSAMKDIAMQTAEAMFQAFATGLLSPLTAALSGLGKTLSGVLMGGIGGGGGAAGAATGAGGAAAGGAGGGLGAIGAFATNPITIAVAGAIAAGFAINHFVGQGRKSANEFVQSVENPFGKNLSALVDSFDSMKKAGTLTEDAAKNARDAVSKLWDEFLKANTDFAKQGGTEAKVAGQSLAHFAEIFGPNLQKIFQSMDDTIASLQHGGVAGVAATAAGASNAPITVNNDYNPSFTFYGVPESLEREIRDTIEPALMSDFANNTRGLTAQLVTILENARNGVTNQIPATV